MNKVKTIEIQAKCSDSCCITLIGADGKMLLNRVDYVPDWAPGDGNNCIELKIDVATGQILGWKPPSQETLEAWAEGREA